MSKPTHRPKFCRSSSREKIRGISINLQEIRGKSRRKLAKFLSIPLSFLLICWISSFIPLDALCCKSWVVRVGFHKEQWCHSPPATFFSLRLMQASAESITQESKPQWMSVTSRSQIASDETIMFSGAEVLSLSPKRVGETILQTYPWQRTQGFPLVTPGHSEFNY